MYDSWGEGGDGESDLDDGRGREVVAVGRYVHEVDEVSLVSVREYVR
jgi:hypothetical protein